MKQFTKGQPQYINIKWSFGPPVHSPEEQAPHPNWKA
ncbi:unnamed protein product [Rhizoctonia solani]|nr:unnamed protein product [Rhizoctonia solani]